MLPVARCAEAVAGTPARPPTTRRWPSWWRSRCWSGADWIVNGYNIEADKAKSGALYALAKQLLADGMPLNGVGLQPPLVVGRVASTTEADPKRFSDLGLEVSVTGLDLRNPLPACSCGLARRWADYETVGRNWLGVARCAGGQGVGRERHVRVDRGVLRRMRRRAPV